MSVAGRKHSPDISRQAADEDNDKSYAREDLKIGHLLSLWPPAISRAPQGPVNG
jgi:hypothetical protein